MIVIGHLRHTPISRQAPPPGRRVTVGGPAPLFPPSHLNANLEIDHRTFPTAPPNCSLASSNNCPNTFTMKYTTAILALAAAVLAQPSTNVPSCAVSSPSLLPLPPLPEPLSSSLCAQLTALPPTEQLHRHRHPRRQDRRLQPGRHQVHLRERRLPRQHRLLPRGQVRQGGQGPGRVLRHRHLLRRRRRRPGRGRVQGLRCLGEPLCLGHLLRLGDLGRRRSRGDGRLG